MFINAKNAGQRMLRSAQRKAYTDFSDWMKKKRKKRRPNKNFKKTLKNFNKNLINMWYTLCVRHYLGFHKKSIDG